MGLWADLMMFGRYTAGLRDFLSQPLSDAQAETMARRSLAEREGNFLRLAELGIFGQPDSPYRWLFREAGCEWGDLRKMVAADGLEATLQKLMAGGVGLSYEEFKGRKPITRGGRTRLVQMSEFANPLLLGHYETRTSGSRSKGSRVLIDLDLFTHEAAWHHHFLKTFELLHRPMALWRPLPPGSAGLQNVLRQVRLGRPVAKWFSQNPPRWGRDSWKHLVLTHLTTLGSRWWHRPLPAVQYVPLEQASRIAGWLADQRRHGVPAWLDTNASSGVRVCQAALDHGLDIRGTVFRFGGEPYTQAKANQVAATGSRAVSHYSMAEIGRIGAACAHPAALDEVHVMTDKLAVLEQPTRVGKDGITVPALVYTTLHPSCPLILFNVASDDYGVLGPRACGCPLEAAGLHLHLHTIRSYEKLNSEGMTFFGGDLFPVIEEVLPRRFGGQSTDYQFVETEENGLPRVRILVSPQVGPVDEGEIVATVLRALRAVPDGGMMAQRWQAGQTLSVLRRPAYTTAGAKTLPLHILGPKGETGA